MLTDMHPEDVKAALRKRFGSVAKFERMRGLPEKSVHDMLRQRKSARVSRAIEAALTEPLPKASPDHAPAISAPVTVESLR